MQSVLKEKNDIKIFILYLMRNIGYALDFENINDIVVQDGFVNYFDFAECFAELLETGNIAEEKWPSGNMYKITEQGIHVADTLQSNLLGMLREKSLKSALRLLSFKKRGSDISFETQDLPNGRVKVTCCIIEGGEEIMRTTVTADSTVQLEKMRYNFYDKPETVYRGMLALLSGDVNYLLE